ncbi:hypothetical protein CRP01_22370 [Flavilitoribacter nigricans DSM 23189 = NBRC 102662]|uniref:DUF1772 domain-containing protein n=1 Tax=Flavilitoribacter nigricans (strain ATCC 23147 / DSM 23189 / NBRC 102662 / NCIMB 1420 / SS-2) TaxID=1122177 RepID=A0A2D0N7N2_FLAN2|nr:hypothetical protein CRP01_22370 [Flavilitoribacter nigricans DSM 23189 = NBRC 102662]
MVKRYKDLIYALLCLSFAIIIGAAVYEHLAVWPRAYDAPPKSLSMFQGEFGLNPAPFWQSIHPVTLLLFTVTLIISWKTDRRKHVLLPLIGYVLVLITTFIYFVPELMEIVNTEYDDTVNQELTKRASQWESLSLFRLVLLIVLSLVLNIGLTKGNSKIA